MQFKFTNGEAPAGKIGLQKQKIIAAVIEALIEYDLKKIVKILITYYLMFFFLVQNS